MTQIDGDARSKKANSVAHQMYVELKETITQSIRKTIDEVKETAEQVKDDPADATERWQETLTERTTDFERKGYRPGSIGTCEAAPMGRAVWRPSPGFRPGCGGTQK